jgi:hypothetical protein
MTKLGRTKNASLNNNPSVVVDTMNHGLPFLPRYLLLLLFETQETKEKKAPCRYETEQQCPGTANRPRS